MGNRIVVVHGIWSHGESMDPLIEKLREKGHEVIEFEFPKRYALSVYWPGVAKSDGGSLAYTQREGDHLVAHSYGCLIGIESIKLGAKWGNCYFFGGAATSDKMYYPDDAFKKCYVIYNPEDSALKWGARLPWHDFGHMGLKGITGQPGRDVKDPRIENVRGFRDDFLQIDHSHYLGKELNKWHDFIEKTL